MYDSWSSAKPHRRLELPDLRLDLLCLRLAVRDLIRCGARLGELGLGFSDLCLRLSERGLRGLLAPDCRVEPRVGCSVRRDGVVGLLTRYRARLDQLLIALHVRAGCASPRRRPQRVRPVPRRSGCARRRPRFAPSRRRPRAWRTPAFDVCGHDAHVDRRGRVLRRRRGEVGARLAELRLEVARVELDEQLALR